MEHGYYNNYFDSSYDRFYDHFYDRFYDRFYDSDIKRNENIVDFIVANDLKEFLKKQFEDEKYFKDIFRNNFYITDLLLDKIIYHIELEIENINFLHNGMYSLICVAWLYLEYKLIKFELKVF